MLNLVAVMHLLCTTFECFDFDWLGTLQNLAGISFVASPP